MKNKVINIIIAILSTIGVGAFIGVLLTANYYPSRYLSVTFLMITFISFIVSTLLFHIKD